MKAQAHSPKARTYQARRPTSSTLGNHRTLRRDKYERQADEAVARIFRGETGVARSLTPASAASLKVPASRGTRLAIGVREGLEAAFGADLSRVRVHVGHEADSVARQEGAVAFTSGLDIYFADGAYRPQDETGERLLAHELAHVIQQTGRASADGRMRATDAIGSGEIQRQSFPEFSKLTELHEPKDAKAKANYKKVADKLAEIVKNNLAWTTDLTIASQIEAFKDKPPTPIKDWPAEAESLLYDSLKAVGKYDAAFALLKRDNFAGGARIKTILFVEAVGDRFLSDVEAAYASFSKHPLVNGFWAEFWRLIKLFLFQPIGDPPPILYGRDENKKLVTLGDYTKRLAADGLNPGIVTDNEWASYGLLYLEVLDDERVLHFKKIQSDASAALAAGPTGKGASEAQYKTYYAHAVVLFGKAIEARKLVDPAESKLAEPFYRRTGKDIIKIGEAALAIWSRVSEIERERLEMFSRFTDEAEAFAADPIKEFAGRKALAPLFKSLRTHLTKVAVTLFAPGKDNQRPPPVAEYVGRAATLAADLRAYLRKELEPRQATLFIQGNTDDVVGLTLLLNWVDKLAHLVADAEKREKGALVAESADFRIAHRIRVARRLYYLVRALGWGDLVKEVFKVVFAEADLESQFALLSDWEPDADAPIEKMLKDFNLDNPLRGWEPITTRVIVYLFRAQYYDALAEELRITLPADLTASSIGISTQYAPILNAAVKEVQTNLTKFDRPRRWKVKSAEAAVKQLKESDVAKVLAKHPKTAALVASESAKGRRALYPLYRTTVDSLYLWTVPGYSKLVEQLRQTKLLNLRVVLELKRARIAKEPRDLTEGEWLELIRRHALRSVKDRGFTDEDRKTFADEVLHVREDAYQRLIPELRRAFNHHRLVLGLTNIAVGLSNYATTSNKYRLYDEPLHAISAIDLFGYSVAPPEDADLQLAALMLEIAPSVALAFGSEDRFDLVGYLYRIEDTEKTVAKSRNVLKRDFLPRDEQADAWIDGRLGNLKSVKPRLKAIAAEMTLFNGFRAHASTSVLLNLYKGLSIHKNIPFEANNKMYTPLEVRRSFVYHATYGYPPPKGKTSTSAYLEPKVLAEDGKTLLVADPNEVLLVFEIDGKETPITKQDTKLLDEVTAALDVQTFQLYIAGTSFIVNKIAEIGLELAELIPGVGQGITATRLGVVIASFFTSGDYKLIKKFFGEGIKGVLEGLLEDIKQAFTAENLVLFLVFGDARLDALVARFQGNEKKNKRPPRPGGFGKVRKVIEAFHNLGPGLLKALEGVHARVAVPVRGFQGYAATRPAIGFVLNFAAEHLDVLATLVTLDFSKIPLSQAELEALLKKEQEGVARQVRGLVDTMEHLELPETVLNTEAIWQFIIDELLQFIMNNMGLKGKLIARGVKAGGVLDQATRRVARELVGAGLDPNYFWITYIVPEIQGSFTTVRNEIVASINSVLSAKVFGGAFNNVDPPSDTQIELTGEGFPETTPDIGEEAGSVQPLPERDGPLAPAPEDIPGVYGGTPLAPGLRSHMESSYGHDFRHVRLHTDSEAMTRAFGAEGLTTGSHVYLKPGLEPEAGHGREVLQHELVHVLQQTGARPLGAHYSAHPSVGSPDKKLDYDPDQEAAATAASAAVSRGTSHGPVPFGEESEEGFQPLLGEHVLSRVLKTLSDLEDIRKEADVIESLKPRALAKETEAAVLKLVSIVMRPEDNQPKVKGNDPFTGVDTLKDIQSNLAKFQAEIRRAALVLAGQTMMHVVMPAAAKAKKKKIKVLNPGPFIHRLEGYLLGKTGIRIVFERNEAKDPTGTYEILPDDPIKSLEIRGIHLPFIGGGSPLWTKAIDYTWRSNPKTPLDPKIRADIQGDVRIYLAANTVITGLWATGNEYKFNLAFKNLVDVYRTTTRGPKLDPSQALPSWNDYVRPDPPAPGDQVGLRRGKYGDTTQKGSGRESHHTTQYLLGEYFRNVNTVKPFHEKWDYPGVQWDKDKNASKVLAIRKPKAKRGDLAGAIEVQKTEIGHGSAMPAILLAAETHEGGKLHVTPEPDDVTKTGPSRQGNAVDREFHSNSGMSDIRTAAAGTKTQFGAYVAKTGQAKVHESIYNAAQETYRWMRGLMLKQFESNMPRMEFEYYMDRYRERPPSLRNPADIDSAQEGLFKAALGQIPAAVKTNNDTLLEALGWHNRK